MPTRGAHRFAFAVALGAAAIGACARERNEDGVAPRPAASSAPAGPSSPVSAASADTATPSDPVTGAGTDAGSPGGAIAGMIEIPAAFYMMGSRQGTGDAEERPMHEVALASFHLDRTEVTVDAYGACVEASACPASAAGAFCNAGVEGRGDHPINCVDHGAATAYCAFVGKRLPSEREWEYAASAGNEKRKFAWGDDDPDGSRACYWHAGTCPVGSFVPGAFGLVDMSGNVWEWTATWFGPYPEETTQSSTRVYRGGSWSRRFPKWLRNTLRNRYQPTEWSAALGFRCARTRLPLVCPEDADARGETCVRARGTPQCEPGYAWNDRGCALNGNASLVAGREPASAVIAAHRGAAPRAPSPPSEAAQAPEPDAPAQVSRSRDAGFDADCKAHYAGVPAAYRISGGTFHDREPVVRASGCKKRDVGRTWTSVCCAQ